MADITEELNVIENAVSGEAVRSAVVSAISKIYSDLGGNADRMSDILEGLKSGTKGAEIKESLVGGVEELSTKYLGSDLYFGFLNGELTSVDIPEGVTEITQWDMYKFAGQKNLIKIHLPSTVESVNSIAFSKLSSLLIIEAPSSLETSQYIPWGAPNPNVQVIFY